MPYFNQNCSTAAKYGSLKELRALTYLYPSSGQVSPTQIRSGLASNQRLIAVDRLRRKPEDGCSQVQTLCSDNNAALGQLFDESVTIDAVLALNDGCREGGNYECVNSDNFFSRLMPVLADRSLYVTDHRLVSTSASFGYRGQFLDVPVQAEPTDDIPGIVFQLRPDLRKRHDRLRGWILTKATRETTIVRGRYSIRLHRDSMLGWADRLGALFFRGNAEAQYATRRYFGFESSGKTSEDHSARRIVESPGVPTNATFPGGQSRRNFLQNCQMVCFVEETNTNAIKRFLQNALYAGAREIGFMPLGKKSLYPALIQWLDSIDLPPDVTLHFFHLNADDFRYLYGLGSDRAANVQSCSTK